LVFFARWINKKTAKSGGFSKLNTFFNSGGFPAAAAQIVQFRTPNFSAPFYFDFCQTG
jgi:hypothetical protein